MSNFEREFSWDDQIEKESEFVLLPEGEYDFTVTKFDRARHNGSEKLPSCPKAIVFVQIDGKDKGNTTIQHNLFLHSKCEGMLCEFFIALGLKKHGEPLKMDWSKVTGAKGRCKVGIRKFTKKDGTPGESNEIKRFLEPSEQPVPTTNFGAWNK